MDKDKRARRSYNEKEVGALIQRATELHEESIGASERSLSLEEVELIAAELGVPAEYMHAAALELEEEQNDGSIFSILGGPFAIDQARVVEGTMTEEQWADAVLELQRFSGSTGKINDLGRVRQWMHSIGEGDEGINFIKTRATLRPGDGQTSIRIRKQFGGVAFAAYAAAFAVVAFLTSIMVSDPTANIALGLGLSVGALVGVRTLLVWWTRRQKEKIKRLTDRLQQMLSTSASQTSESEPTTARIDLPELDERPELEASEERTAEGRRGVRA